MAAPAKKETAPALRRFFRAKILHFTFMLGLATAPQADGLEGAQYLERIEQAAKPHKGGMFAFRDRAKQIRLADEGLKPPPRRPKGSTEPARARHCNENTVHDVLQSLIDHADEYGVAWPSPRLIAHEANCSIGSVKRALRTLIRLGRILRLERWQLEGKHARWWKLEEPRASFFKVLLKPLDPATIARVPEVLEALDLGELQQKLRPDLYGEDADPEEEQGQGPSGGGGNAPGEDGASEAPAGAASSPPASSSSSSTSNVNDGTQPPASSPPASSSGPSSPAAPWPAKHVERIQAALSPAATLADDGERWRSIDATSFVLELGLSAKKNLPTLEKAIGYVVNRARAATISSGQLLKPGELGALLLRFIPIERPIDELAQAGAARAAKEPEPEIPASRWEDLPAWSEVWRQKGFLSAATPDLPDDLTDEDRDALEQLRQRGPPRPK